MDLKEYHAKPIQHLKTMHITAMGQPACPYLVSVSTGEGKKKRGILEEIAAGSSVKGTSLLGDHRNQELRAPKNSNPIV